MAAAQDVGTEMGVRLPSYRHLPGVNARPRDGVLARIAQTAPEVTASADALSNPAWRHGVAFLKAGFYWEAHEVLEPVWLNAPPNSRERALVQGTIQFANAALKALLDRPNATRRLAEIAIGHFAEAGGPGSRPVMAIAPGAAIATVEAFKAALAAGNDWSASVSAFPHIG